MKSKFIEVQVNGPTGVGKSEVLAVIHQALCEFYNPPDGSKIKVCGDVDKSAIVDAKVTRQTAKHEDVFIVLREQNLSKLF